MKKIILFSLASIICSTFETKINAMQWQTIRNKIDLHNHLTFSGSKLVLANNASWEEFYKQQNDEFRLCNIGNYIAQDYKDNPSDFHSELLKTTTKLYINAIVQKDKLATLHYTNYEDQKRYQLLINDLRKLSQE